MVYVQKQTNTTFPKTKLIKTKQNTPFLQKQTKN